jgi:tetratricopeptide (TPR) repeat protein
MLRAILAALLLGLAAVGAAADTIVLKSGRRVTATRVVEEGDRIYYETSAGRFSFPRSIVERIERGDAPSAVAEPEVPVAPAGLELARGFDDIARAAVPGDAIDHDFIARLERQARQGGPQDASRVLVARHAAAQFEIARGDLSAAIEHYRRGLTFTPENLTALLLIAHLHLRRSEYTAALEYLERARRVAPDSPDVASGLGWAYYRLNKLDLAVREWKRSLALRPSTEVARALERAQRDLEEEAGYRENESRHFQLRSNGASSPALAREVLRTLEAHFREIEAALNYTPPEPIAVILYTDQAFVDVTRAPAWAGAINDGRIRIPVQGLESVTSELSATLKHELVHSFVYQKTREHCPVWLNEGIAQYLEGKRIGEQAAALVQLYDAGRSIPLAQLEGYWTNLNPQAAAFAYAWSLAAVEYLLETYGMRDIERLLERLPAAASPEEALRSVLRYDYAELEAVTARYLKRASRR